MKQTYKEIAKYGIVGVIGLGVDLGFFLIFNNLIGIPYVISHIMSSILAILNNFIFNSYFTFKATDKIVKRGVSFFGIAAIGLVISSLLLSAGVSLYNNQLCEYIQIDNPKTVETISKLFATVFVAALQFVANKFLTFRKAAPPTSPEGEA
ncbi:GtrA family protein [Viscerimonas tarda]